MPEFLLEVGFEEMPAPWLGGLGEQVVALFERLARERFLEPAGVQSFFTPRRLVVAGEVAARQADREERVWGPSLKVAKAADGAWSNAATGFARKVGSSHDALEAMPKDPAAPNDLYLSFVRRTPGRATVEVLPAVVASVLRGLAFPKRMSWDAWLDDGKGAFPFGRPIRWVVALLDGAIVPFTIFELVSGQKGPVAVESGTLTRGHRFLPRDSEARSAAIHSLAELRNGLRKLFVLLDPAEREARVAAQLAEHNGGTPVANDHGLAAEWRDLVEYPTVLAGTVPAEFRSLPTEVLETVLVHHQKYVPLLSGGTVERFAAVVNGDGANAEAVVRNMERVVVARLRDAAFFWAEDRKRRLEDRVGELGGITFHKGLGTYLDKTNRLGVLRGFMSAEGWIDPRFERTAAKAVSYCKVDLVTQMVREFPELQGIMGGLYLRGGDVPEAACEAIKWHYHPVAVEERSVPARAFDGHDATVFAALSLADKMDTLAGYFGLGVIPTGSSDPFGLRRAAHGCIRVVLDFWPAGSQQKLPNLRWLAAEALRGYQTSFPKSHDEVLAALIGFLEDRLRYVLIARGLAAETVAAVLAAEIDALADVRDALTRAKALESVRDLYPDEFDRLASAFKRAKNIRQQAESKGWGFGVMPYDPLEPGPEKALLDALNDVNASLDFEDTSQAGYERRFRALAALRAPVDAFFEKVMVLADDFHLREMRLALMRRVIEPILRLADVSQLGGAS